jgi:hypothetical protein
MAIFAALLLIVSACEATRVQSDYLESFSFAGHDTFAWVSEHPMVVHSADVSPFAEERIAQAIINVLQQKGVRHVDHPADAELLVGFTVSAKEKISVHSTPYPVPYWGMYPWVGDYYQGAYVHQYTEGRLTIDIFDTAEKLPVWHGSATKNVGVDDEQKGKRMANEAVAAILATFPPGAVTQ